MIIVLIKTGRDIMEAKNRQNSPEPGTGAGNRRGRGAGPGGHCLCPHCRLSVPHNPGVPCNDARCPKCGAALIRDVRAGGMN